MGFNFKKAAQEATSLSPIMMGRTKLETEEILGKELTINGFNFAPKFDKDGNAVVDPETGVPDEFGVVTFVEFPDKYYCVGAVFTKVCKMWASEFETVEQASEALAAEGGVRAKFTASKTKKGNNLVAVDILD